MSVMSLESWLGMMPASAAALQHRDIDRAVDDADFT
jgi:hypothetical protein